MQAQASIPSTDAVYPCYTLAFVLQKAANNQLNKEQANENSRNLCTEARAILTIISDILQQKPNFATTEDIASAVSSVAGMLEAAEILSTASEE